MRNFASSSVFALLFVTLVGCPPPKSSTQTPTATTGAQPAPGQYPAAQYPAQQYPAQGAPPPGYAQQPQPGYAQQPPPASYPQQGYAPQPTAGAPAGPTQPGAAPSATPVMATPGPLALPCQNDQQCGLAHCNTQYAKCAFPCQGAVNCIQGASCNTLTGFCLPGGG